MNQVVSRNHLKQYRRLPFVGLLLLLFTLTACLGGSEDDGAAPELTLPETTFQQAGTLTCSPACQAQGQCGIAADGRSVILAHGTEPTLRDHNVILENESAILILEQQARTVREANETISTYNFFAVQPPEGGPTNWVAGSCVSRTAQQ